MTAEILLALTGFSLVTSATPGPNNMMLMASGANFGLRRTVPHIMGVSLGFGAMVAILGMGLDRIVMGNAALAGALKWASLAYVLWLAWKIATAAPPSQADAPGRPLGFLGAAAFQWVNPKAWAMALGALSAYAAGVGGPLVVAVIFAAVNLPLVAAWAAAGQGLQGLLAHPARLRAFNAAMAALLVLSMLPVVF
ncbi:LysE family translocator [Paracoccus shandongensis]|uniref:LysE family translocator n=1 Tax=Paracoccus shandongensis TaxID=2816048 RepID=UPI001A8C4FC3|nr:LysE family translocator [Paracoccus shandongensis]